MNTVAYLTKSWRVVHFDFGLPANSSLLPAVLWVRWWGDAPSQAVVEPAWLVTASLLASLAWRVDVANADGPADSQEVRDRLRRWFGVCDTLREEMELLRSDIRNCYAFYTSSGGPAPLPTPPSLLALSRTDGVMSTPWDGVISQR